MGPGSSPVRTTPVSSTPTSSSHYAQISPLRGVGVPNSGGIGTPTYFQVGMMAYHCAENSKSRSLAHYRVDFFILSGLVLPVVGQPETSSEEEHSTVMRRASTLTVLSAMVWMMANPPSRKNPRNSQTNLEFELISHIPQSIAIFSTNYSFSIGLFLHHI